MVNRLWQNHFGRGIVATPSDFGTQGAEPIHPELLDWLATEFVARGWSLKAMHRLMVTSATYRQSSTPTAKTLDDDPENTLFSRMSRRRLEGEAVRDALLAVSGRARPAGRRPERLPRPAAGRRDPRRLDALGVGRRPQPPEPLRLRPPQPEVSRSSTPSTPPTRTSTCPERNVCVNAPQALMLLNSDLVLEQARAPRRPRAGSRRRPERPDRPGARRVPARAGPRPRSRPRSTRGVDLPRRPSPRCSAPGPTTRRRSTCPMPMPDGGDPAQGAALVDYCHVLLNLNEFVFVD